MNYYIVSNFLSQWVRKIRVNFFIFPRPTSPMSKGPLPATIIRPPKKICSDVHRQTTSVLSNLWNRPNTGSRLFSSQKHSNVIQYRYLNLWATKSVMKMWIRIPKAIWNQTHETRIRDLVDNVKLYWVQGTAFCILMG